MDSCEERISNDSVDSSSTDVDITFLPLIYEIIRSLERDPHDPAQKNAQSQDISQKVLEIQKKLDEARDQIRELPGIEYNKRDQKLQLKHLRNQLQLKRQLILKFRNMYPFDFRS
ncbi:hypothetical protein V9T40_008234 [Parthenolecanium corni]|uniref:Mediator of RNA polymerase II transcription subunit 9 n=1 Tax=Parthenolecanium corni TaxID=536013 RepID=A0AAN9TMR6_9HEMI